MNKIIDPALEEHSSVTHHDHAYDFVILPKRVKKVVAAYTQLIWDINNFDRSYSTIEIITNVQDIFARDEAKRDLLWKEHCASSLRELVDGHFYPNARQALMCLPDRSGEAAGIYKTIGQYKELLSEIAHLKTSTKAVQLASSILEREVSSIDDKIFDEICKNFIFSFYELFNEYCVRGS